jgi:hypothetical protein
VILCALCGWFRVGLPFQTDPLPPSRSKSGLPVYFFRRPASGGADFDRRLRYNLTIRLATEFKTAPGGITARQKDWC